MIRIENIGRKNMIFRHFCDFLDAFYFLGIVSIIWRMLILFLECYLRREDVSLPIFVWKCCIQWMFQKSFQANCECFAPAVSILFISNKDFSVFVCIFKCFVCFLVQFFCVIVILKRGLPMFILFLIQYFRDLIFIL